MADIFDIREAFLTDTGPRYASKSDVMKNYIDSVQDSMVNRVTIHGENVTRFDVHRNYASWRITLPMAHTCTRIGSLQTRGIIKHKVGLVDSRDVQDTDQLGGPKRLRKSVILHAGMLNTFCRLRAQEQLRQRET